jgi:Flp pilus assembly pilin Flp
MQRRGPGVRHDVFGGVDAVADVTGYANRQQGKDSMGILIRWTPKLAELQKGQTLAEYAPILVVIAVLVYAAYQVIGTEVSSLVNSAVAAF